MRNLITDVAGIQVGHADNAEVASGVTALIFDEPVVAAIDVRGGGPGTRESDLLDPQSTLDRIDGLTLSGGSAYGLDAAGGVQGWLAEHGRGYPLISAVIPIVPGAIMFDLLNGGNKAWGRFSPYRELGYAAAAQAGPDFALGSAGAGLGATTVNLKGGVGSASAQTKDGITVGAIVIVNAVGSVTVGDGPHFWAAPFEQNGEFGGLGLPSPFPADALDSVTKGQPRDRGSTTIAAVATDAVLTKAQARRLAIMAQTALPRAIYPIHTPLDGDVVFAIATGKNALQDPVFALTNLGTVAANVLARAVARAVYEATALSFPGALPDWKSRFAK